MLQEFFLLVLSPVGIDPGFHLWIDVKASLSCIPCGSKFSRTQEIVMIQIVNQINRVDSCENRHSLRVFVLLVGLCLISVVMRTLRCFYILVQLRCIRKILGYAGRPSFPSWFLRGSFRIRMPQRLYERKTGSLRNPVNRRRLCCRRSTEFGKHRRQGEPLMMNIALSPDITNTFSTKVKDLFRPHIK